MQRKNLNRGRRGVSRLALLVLAAGLIGGAAATPVDAGGSSWFSWGSRRSCGTPSYGHGNYGPAHAAREFRRGFDSGASRGFSIGYQDAVNGRPFCDTPHNCSPAWSVHFRKGFDAAYGGAYRKAFNFGKNACVAHRF